MTKAFVHIYGRGPWFGVAFTSATHGDVLTILARHPSEVLQRVAHWDRLGFLAGSVEHAPDLLPAPEDRPQPLEIYYCDRCHNEAGIKTDDNRSGLCADCMALERQS